MSGRISRFGFAVAVLFLVVTATESAAADEVTYKLAYRFQPGQFLHYQVLDKVLLTTQLENNQVKAANQTACFRSYRVVSVDDENGTTIEPIIEQVRMASQFGDNVQVSYDSLKDEAPPKEFESVAGTIGRPLARFQLAPNGRLLKVTMLVSDAPKKLTESAKKTDPTINILTVFPDHPLKIGEKWTEKYEIPVVVGNGLTQNIQMIRSFELEKVVDSVATIQFRTSALSPQSDTEVLRKLIQEMPTGTVEFDIKQGLMLSRKLHYDEKVLNAFGAKTMMQAQGESTETMLTIPPKTRITNNGPAVLPK